MKKLGFLFALISFSTATFAELPDGVVCLQNITSISCSSKASDCFNGNRASATCSQTALFKTDRGTFISSTKSGNGESYECGLITDKSKAESNAKADLAALAGAFGLVPRCSR